MSEALDRQTVSFPSADGTSQIKGMIWKSSATGVAPRGIVQLVHGMTEHIARYDHFACFLAQQGFVVCGHDHIGHGKSVPNQSEFGHMPPDDGENVLIEDVHKLRTIVAARFARTTPYIIFGHSMGSFVVRVYLTRYGAGLAGAVLCGTGNKPRVVSSAGHALSRLVARTRGPKAKSALIHSLADGAYAKAIDNPRTEFDWLSVSEENVDAFIADETTGFMFTAGGYATLTALTRDAARLDLARNIPSDLPLLYIAGEHDPVGDNGKGVRAASQLARRAGVSDVEVILYPNMRHEILNEAGKDEVYADVLTWIEARIAPAPSAKEPRATPMTSAR